MTATPARVWETMRRGVLLPVAAALSAAAFPQWSVTYLTPPGSDIAIGFGAQLVVASSARHTARSPEASLKGPQCVKQCVS